MNKSAEPTVPSGGKHKKTNGDQIISQPANESLSDTYLRPWKKYAQFSGQASRKEYWIISLINFGIYLVLGMLPAMFADPSSEPSPILLVAQLIYFVFALAAFKPSLS